MKKLATVIGLMLVFVLLLSACGTPDAGTPPAPAPAAQPGAAPAAPAQQATLPAPTEGNGTIGNYHFTYWVGSAFGGASRQRISGFEENYAWMEKERITGVTIEWIHPPAGQEADQFSLMMAALDLPDILQQADRLRGGIQTGISDGIFVRLNELIANHAPHYYALINSNPNVRREAFTDEGYLQGFGMLTSDNWGDDWTLTLENPWAGPWINYDFISELGIAVPTSIDEWTVALKAIRDNFDPEIVMAIPQLGLNVNEHGAFVSAFDIAPDWFVVDGTVKWGPAEPNFRYYIELMAYWYSEGLIDPEFPTRHGDDINAAQLRGELGAHLHAGTGFALQAEPEGITFVGAPYPRRYPDSPPLRWSARNNWIRGEWTVITSVNQNPEAAAAWMDWNYSPEGISILNFGPQGISWNEMDDRGVPIYVERFAPPNWDPNNDVFRWHNGPYLKSDLRANPRRVMPHLEAAREVWEEQSEHAIWRLPPVTLTADEGAESAAIMADAIAFRDEMLIGFITGSIPLTELDRYFATMESFNVRRAAEIREAALARFMAR